MWNYSGELTESEAVAAGTAYEVTFAIVGVLASIASLVLAVVAIWLAIKFFQMSNTQAERAAEASKEISGAVERLENLFDRMYSDTFGMVQNMQEKIWQMVPVQDQPAVSAVGETPSPKNGPDTEEPVPAPADIDEIVGDSVGISPYSPELQERLQRTILDVLEQNARQGGKGLTLTHLAEGIVLRSERDLIPALFTLRINNDITWDNDTGALSSRDVIRLSKPHLYNLYLSNLRAARPRQEPPEWENSEI